MKTYIGVMLAAALMLPAGAGAQEKKPFVEARGSVKPVPLPPGGPAPRMSDGHVDLSGNWFPGPTGKANAWSVDPDPRVPEDPVPFQPWAEAKFKAMSRVDLELSNAYMHLIDMKPGLFIHLIENNNRWRVVHTDGRPHKKPDELEPLFNGDETAHWEGDTLVIDSISIDERTSIRDGWFHSDQLHVIERLRRPSKNYLEYQFTVEDPKVLTKPWTSAWRVHSLANEDLTENFNENVEQLRKLTEQQKSGKK
jgi:hypothetical protein